MKLIIVRHGETIENKKGQLQGQLLQGKLNKNGIIQANKLANRLRGEKIDAIYSSPLKRALDTAKIIGKLHPDTSIKIDKRIIERSLGNFEGMYLEKFKSLNLDINDEGIMDKENVEKIGKMIERVKNFIEELGEKEKKKTILICGHFWINNVINYHLLRKKEGLSEYKNIPNASLSIFELKNNSFSPITLGYNKHLDN